jgi:sarcosine oxidase subunit alpha
VSRLPAGGRIDRTRPLTFTYDGVEYSGHGGDTLASALLANGVHAVTRSLKHGRPRGIVSAGVEEPNALVQVGAEPMLTATTVELYDGLDATGLRGKGRLEPVSGVNDKMYAHCDVLVVGAGPAGLAAALAAGRADARVVLMDEQSELGGSLLGTGELAEWVSTAAAELAALPEVRVLPRTTVFGYYDHNYLLAVERRTVHLGGGAPVRTSRQRLWHVRARQVVLATGAHERPLVFAGNDRPGIMLAGAARTYVNRYGILPGQHAVVFTTNDSAYGSAIDLAAAGAAVTVVDARADTPGVWRRRCEERGIEVLAGQVVVGTSGTERVSRAHVAPVDGSGRRHGLVCDVLLVSGGWNPAVHLFSQSRGVLRYDEALATFVPGRSVQAQQVAGAVAGAFTLAGCLSGGADAGAEAARSAGFEPVAAAALPDVDDPPVTPPRPLWLVPAEEWDAHFVDLQRDVTVADVFRATGTGMRSVEHVKRYTTIGTAHDQGKTSGLNAIGVIARALGGSVGDYGTTTFRPPYTPVSFAALAGRERGRLHDPVRVTSIDPWHAAHGAIWENVGQWRRPRYYPAPGEDLETAVMRECAAAREGVAMMDTSTLGKIDVQGSDAAEFLDRVYTNLMSSLAVGSCRYGLMCKVDGMLFDDGVAMRLAPDRFVATTTTGNAAAVLEWLEEWLQTEWPDLRVHCTSVTEHWATVAVVGPGSRAVVGAVAPDLDVSNAAFPFMTWRDTTAAGAPARVARISFSGELAYEINVPSWYGLAVWEAVHARGAMPYGTETMHVLRAEKGYPIVGQETDGTVTPQDLGMGWAVSKRKPDFLGKRSFSRPDTARTDRKQLVGLLPVDPAALLPEGAQLVGAPDSVAMLGHVTSSYRSAALGRTFALALLAGGRERIGETVHAPLGDRVIAATVTTSVLYDKEGTRRDG